MFDDSGKNVIWTCRIADRKPEVAKLIVDGERMALKRKIEPHFSYIVGEVICNSRARQKFDLLSKGIP